MNQMGFDILSNIASEVVLEEQSEESCVTDVMLSTLTSCISSPDRFQVISSLDILNKLCQQEANEHYVGNVLVADQVGVYEQLATYLSLHDIHLLVSALECLYSMSCLGEASCNAIVRTHGAVDALVSLITVEAQSYGPKACILMRVVETVPGTAAAAAAAAAAASAVVQQPIAHAVPVTSVSLANQHTPNRQPQQVTIVSGQVVQQRQTAANSAAITSLPKAPLANIRPSQPSPPQQPVARPIMTVNSTGQQVVVSAATQQVQQHQVVRIQPQPQQQQPLQQTQTQNLQAQIRPTLSVQPSVPAATSVTPVRPQQPSSGSQQVQLRVCNDETNRNFCLSWLNATYESVPGNSIQHEIMYKQYLASLHKLGRSDVISAQHYAACVR